MLAQHPADGDTVHSLATVADQPDSEELARQLDAVENEVRDGKQSLTVLARLRQHATDLADRAAWVTDTDSRKHLLERTRRLLERLG